MSEEPDELIHAEPGLADDRTQSAPVEFFVVRHNYLGQRFVPTQDHMAALLPAHVEADPAQGLDALAARYPRQTTHTATTRVSKCS